MPDKATRTVRCKCGQVTLEAQGEPIVATVCNCASCQKAGAILEQLPGAGRVLDAEGGTALVLFRKDRVRCVRGGENLAEHRLNATSPTRRVVATCCNTAVFLDFTNGHWISIYGDRIPAPGPVADRQSGSFVWRLLRAWAAMAFRTPKIDYVKGRIDGHVT